MGGRLEGQVAIVTGGARGLGKSIAEAFCREGASVLVADIRDELGRETVASLESAGGRAAYVHLDVAAEPDWRAALERCTEAFGVPTVLVNNAAIARDGAVDDETLAYLRVSGRSPEQVGLVEAYAKAQGLFRTDGSPEPTYSDTIELDLASGARGGTRGYACTAGSRGARL